MSELKKLFDIATEAFDVLGERVWSLTGALRDFQLQNGLSDEELRVLFNSYLKVETKKQREPIKERMVQMNVFEQTLELKDGTDSFCLKINGTEIAVKDYTIKNSTKGVVELALTIEFVPSHTVIEIEK